MNATNETTPVIERVDCDRQGRDIHIGIRRGSNTTWLPVMSEEELKKLGSMIDNFIKADKENLQRNETDKMESVAKNLQRNETDKMESVANTVKGPRYNPKFKLWEIRWRGNDGSFGSAWGNSKKEVTEKFNNIMAENNT
jgi:hypothetical protein